MVHSTTNNVRLKGVILIPVALTIILLFVAFVTIFNRTQLQNINSTANDQALRVQNLFESFLASESALLEAQGYFVMRDPALTLALQRGEPTTLLETARPIFEYLNQNYRVTHMYFTGLDRVNILRVHNPANNGDLINRITQLEAERTGQPAAGIELGASGLFTLRMVTPWQVNGRQIGYLELGMEIDHIIALLHDSLDEELVLFIEKQYMNQSAWEAGMASIGRSANWNQFANVAVIDSTLNRLPPALDEAIISDLAAGTLTDTTLTDDDAAFHVTALPLINAANQELGKFLVLDDISSERSTLATNTLLVTVVVAIAGGVLILFFNFYVGRIEKRQQGLVMELQVSQEEASKHAAASDSQRAELESSHEEIERRAAIEREQRQQLQNLITQVKELIATLNQSTTEIQSAAMQQMASMTQQDASVTETAATLEQVRATVKETSERAQSVARAAEESVNVSKRGEQAVSDTIAGMTVIRDRVENIAETILALSERTQQIGEIIETVNAIADQSKLLALNASIEAARAGEEGKGFAVVAMEVRQLAEQSRDATARVNSILNEIQQATNTSVMVTEEGSKGAERGMELVMSAGEAIRELAGTMAQVTDAAVQIAASTHQQTNGMEQLATAMHQIKQGSTEAAASARQAERSVANLGQTAKKLEAAAAQYNDNGSHN